MADTYNYKVTVSTKDNKGNITYPNSTAYSLSITDQVMYHIAIYKNGTYVQNLTDNSVSDNTHALTKVTGALVKSSSPAHISGQSTWKTSQNGSSVANWLAYVSASGTALVTPSPADTLVQYYDTTTNAYVNIPHDSANLIPTVTFSVAKSVPTLPAPTTQMIKDLQLFRQGLAPTDRVSQDGIFIPLTVTNANIFQNPCATGPASEYWVSPITIPVLTPPSDQPSFTLKYFRYVIKFYNKDGSTGAPDVAFNPKDAVDQAKQLTKFNDYIHSIKSLVFCPTVNKNILPGSGASDPKSSTIVTAPSASAYAKAPVIWNPPNNINTRKNPYGIQGKAINAYDGSYLRTVGVADAAPLGYIVQDANTAAAVNSLSSTGAANLWGFRFNYNPTTISYGTQSSSSLDVTTFANDPANLVGGNTVVNLELYLNRIADFQDLPGKENNPTDVLSMYPIPAGFTTASSISDPGNISGILTRGTEYDLEFLYRVVNGNPRANDLLSGNGTSSDFGYITGVPFRLVLHDNMRYFCSIQTITVNHVMFTPDMIPILSVVSLSLLRYPGLTTVESQTFSSLQYNSLQSTNLTPPTTTTPIK